ncbi:MAG: ribonuclease HII [Rhabdochlamydiaceae bacterium]|nr:ribonuclease HII [Candidatus Amphrikana amoebophyrae]
MLNHEFRDQAQKKGYQNIAGIDEAGRGPLAGPVVAAAAILSDKFILDGINDSKKLSPKKREALYEQIIASDEVTFGIGIVPPSRIDEINILQATFMAMSLAVNQLSIVADLLLIDGNQSPKLAIPDVTVVKGDSKELSIAVASILAKVTRDRIMIDLDEKYPHYGFAKHMGYPTKAHIEALTLHGVSPVHRLSFGPVKKLAQMASAFST